MHYRLKLLYHSALFGQIQRHSPITCSRPSANPSQPHRARRCRYGWGFGTGCRRCSTLGETEHALYLQTYCMLHLPQLFLLFLFRQFLLLDVGCPLFTHLNLNVCNSLESLAASSTKGGRGAILWPILEADRSYEWNQFSMTFGIPERFVQNFVVLGKSWKIA